MVMAFLFSTNVQHTTVCATHVTDGKEGDTRKFLHVWPRQHMCIRCASMHTPADNAMSWHVLSHSKPHSGQCSCGHVTIFAGGLFSFTKHSCLQSASIAEHGGPHPSQGGSHSATLRQIPPLSPIHADSRGYCRSGNAPLVVCLDTTELLTTAACHSKCNAAAASGIRSCSICCKASAGSRTGVQ